MAKRQTVWLSSMMILSLMVIGYYTVDDTLKPIPTSSSQSAKNNADPAKKQDQQKQGETKEQNGKSASAESDWFIQQMIKQTQNYSSETEKLQKVIADSKTSSDEKMAAEKDMKALTEFMEKAETAAEKVMAEGYQDALVTRDNSQIVVTVQAPEITKEQAAKIYGIVMKELNVPANKITLTYRQ